MFRITYLDEYGRIFDHGETTDTVVKAKDMALWRMKEKGYKFATIKVEVAMMINNQGEVIL